MRQCNLKLFERRFLIPYFWKILCARLCHRLSFENKWTGTSAENNNWCLKGFIAKLFAELQSQCRGHLNSLKLCCCSMLAAGRKMLWQLIFKQSQHQVKPQLLLWFGFWTCSYTLIWPLRLKQKPIYGVYVLPVIGSELKNSGADLFSVRKHFIGKSWFYTSSLAANVQIAFCCWAMNVMQVSHAKTDMEKVPVSSALIKILTEGQKRIISVEYDC